MRGIRRVTEVASFELPVLGVHAFMSASAEYLTAIASKSIRTSLTPNLGRDEEIFEDCMNTRPNPNRRHPSYPTA